MADKFEKFYSNLDSPAKGAFVVTTANTDLDISTRSFYVGVAGNVTFITVDGSVVNNMIVSAGTYHPIRVKQFTTATTANGIIGFY